MLVSPARLIALWREWSRAAISAQLTIPEHRSCIIVEARIGSSYHAEPQVAQQGLTEKLMKTGIIGLPQVGKTPLFRILTKAKIEDHGRSNPREAHIGGPRSRRAAQQTLSSVFAKKDDLCLSGLRRRGGHRTGGTQGNCVFTNLRNVDALIDVLRG